MFKATMKRVAQILIKDKLSPTSFDWALFTCKAQDWYKACKECRAARILCTIVPLFGTNTVREYAVVKPLSDEPTDEDLLSLPDLMIPRGHAIRRNVSEEDEDFEPAPGAPTNENYYFDMIV